MQTNYMDVINKIRKEINGVVIGKEKIVDKVLIALLSGGHILLEDIPGVGKTTMALAFASALGLEFKRAQFTPDVLPSDIVGYGMYNAATGEMEYKEGAVVCNLFLADEINRTSSKTQSALLEVMEEGKVTVDGVTRKLPDPFIVMATQNPNGSIGTHNLPESQLDRFMVKLSMGYPEVENEVEILKGRNNRQISKNINGVINADEFIKLKEFAQAVYVHDEMYDYIARIAKATRENKNLDLGLSPRGSIALCDMARTTALINGRGYVLPDDVMNTFIEVASHRVVLSPAARIEKKTANEVLTKIMESVKTPKIKA